MKKIYKDFIENNLETTLKLMEVLSKIFTDDSLKNKLVLKGGSAVNFYIGDLTRLFLDVDLDLQVPDEAYIKQEKEKLSLQLLGIMEYLDYEYSFKKSRHSYSLDSFCFPYKKKNGNIDYLKIEINYSCSNHLYPDDFLPKRESIIDTDISILNLNELVGMKLKALYDRTSVKDLFDIFQLINIFPSLNDKAIRKSFLFYYTLASLKYENDTINRIKCINKKDLISTLYPVIPKKSGCNLEIMKRSVLEFAYDIFSFTSNELEFAEAFHEGFYCPELLFENKDVIERAKQNPIANYKIKLKRMLKQ